MAWQPALDGEFVARFASPDWGGGQRPCPAYRGGGYSVLSSDEATVLSRTVSIGRSSSSRIWQVCGASVRSSQVYADVQWHEAVYVFPWLPISPSKSSTRTLTTRAQVSPRTSAAPVWMIPSERSTSFLPHISMSLPIDPMHNSARLRRLHRGQRAAPPHTATASTRGRARGRGDALHEVVCV